MSKKQIIITVLVVIIVAAIFFVARVVKAPEETVPAQTDNTESEAKQALPAAGKVVTDPDSGKEFISNQLIVEFNTGVSETESLAAIAQVGGKMIARFTAAPLFLVQVDDTEDGSGAMGVRAKLEKDPRVKKVELNFLTAEKALQQEEKVKL